MTKYSVFPEPLTSSFSFEPSNILTDKHGLWRYLNFLPLKNKTNLISLGEPTTPVLKMQIPGGRNVWVKNDMLFPSGSYKDRGAAVLINAVRENKINSVVQDSSGNAGCAIAAYAAAAQIDCTIYVPENTANSKIAQMQASRAKIVKVAGNRKDTSDAVLEAANKTYYASHVYRAAFIHGTKTFLYEIFEQFNGKLPHYLFLPAGNGTLLLGTYMALQELESARLISVKPKLVAVQAAACNPLSRMLNKTQINELAYTSSMAEGIAIENPARLLEMAEAIENTKGMVIDVTEQEITEAWKWLAAQGHFVEPTAAATTAAIMKSWGNLESDAEILTVFTGSGLKSGTKILQYLH